MIVSIHQPHFLPWMGYFNKVLNSDIFVWLHSVQYRKNYFQNRTRIKNNNEQPLWLTLPVHATLGTKIDEVRIADPKWRNRICRTVEQCYRKAPYFNDCWPVLQQCLPTTTDTLDEINYCTFRALLKLLDADSVIVKRIGDLTVEANDPTARLVSICASLGATVYIAGKGGRNYLRQQEFENAGITVLWQDFPSDEVRYSQLGNKFLSGLSLIDCLFNVGPIRTRDLITKAWTPLVASG
jgi:WbqC-like protein